MAEFFNGDWRETDVLVHVCSGSACCRDRAASVSKGSALLQRVVSSVQPRIFNRANWAEWTDAIAFFGWSAVHDVLPDAFQMAFDKATARANAGVAEASQFDDVAASLAMIDVMNAEELYPSTQNAPHDETTGAALSDKVTIERAKFALSLQAALAFFKRGVFQEIFLLRVTLEPERKLMAALLHSSSQTWEEEQMLNLVDYGERCYRLVALHEGELLHAFFVEIFNQWRSPTVWLEHEPTEAFRSCLLQLSMRVGAVGFQLIWIRTRGFPYKMFLLLQPSRASRELAEQFLTTKKCMLDPWSKGFLAVHNSPDLLLGPVAINSLNAIARTCQGNTYSTERLHSRNWKRHAARLTHKADIEHLGLSHTAWAAPPWLRRPDQDRIRKPRGRPLKRHHEEDTAEQRLEQPTKKQRQGAGGAWRAFTHMKLAGQRFTSELMKQCSEEYAALSPEQRAWYEEIGRAVGPKLRPGSSAVLPCAKTLASCCRGSSVCILK
eukprot:6492423-Amphidinium_carterae.2